jgi:hypothetical protein
VTLPSLASPEHPDSASAATSPRPRPAIDFL